MNEDTALALFNVGLAISHLVFLFAIGALISRRLFTRAPEEDLADIGNGRVHARAAVFLLVLYAILGIDTAIGAFVVFNMPDSAFLRDLATVIATAIRSVVTIVLAGWLAYTAEPRIRARSRKAGRWLDRMLHWK